MVDEEGEAACGLYHEEDEVLFDLCLLVDVRHLHLDLSEDVLCQLRRLFLKVERHHSEALIGWRCRLVERVDTPRFR